jgi:hypothetical protein
VIETQDEIPNNIIPQLSDIELENITEVLYPDTDVLTDLHEYPDNTGTHYEKIAEQNRTRAIGLKGNNYGWDILGIESPVSEYGRILKINISFDVEGLMTLGREINISLTTDQESADGSLTNRINVYWNNDTAPFNYSGHFIYYCNMSILSFAGLHSFYRCQSVGVGDTSTWTTRFYQIALELTIQLQTVTEIVERYVTITHTSHKKKTVYVDPTIIDFLRAYGVYIAMFMGGVAIFSAKSALSLYKDQQIMQKVQKQKRNNGKIRKLK